MKFLDIDDDGVILGTNGRLASSGQLTEVWVDGKAVAAFASQERAIADLQDNPAAWAKRGLKPVEINTLRLAEEPLDLFSFDGRDKFVREMTPRQFLKISPIDTRDPVRMGEIEDKFDRGERLTTLPKISYQTDSAGKGTIRETSGTTTAHYLAENGFADVPMPIEMESKGGYITDELVTPGEFGDVVIDFPDYVK